MAETDQPVLRLGTRQSPLAMAQAEEARSRLCAAHGWTQDRVELVKVRATGDKITDRPLADIGGKALWTKELDAWLAEGRIDAAVHSMKDVETVRPDFLAIAAILPRADVRDVLIGAESVDDVPEGARVGTSAPRRAAQFLHHRPDCTIVTFRGNVATRLARLAANEADVTFLAAAGLERLGETGIGTLLDPADWLPAPAQGAIGLECREDDARVRTLLSAIDDSPSRAAVMAERALLYGLGGTCHSPIAAYSCHDGSDIVLTAALFSGDGIDRVQDRLRVPARSPDDARALAETLLGQASDAIRRLFEPA
ncbi:hydroxymethylbilane synthase [Qipengyuania sp. JC766]|uniref:hydroxymethylbilane synthase n=1 Tax=Qipengyuania sp. JC766 TaxID=3232139 RepID=UPI0034581485